MEFSYDCLDYDRLDYDEVSIYTLEIALVAQIATRGRHTRM